MVQVKRIISSDRQQDGKTFEAKVNEFLADKYADSIIDIKMDFGGSPDAGYIAAYIYYIPQK